MSLNKYDFSCIFSVFLMLYQLLCLTTIIACPEFCHDDERSALVQFKNSFMVDCQASDDPLSYPKFQSWKLKINDCCLWDGVSCDDQTGRVIEIDLSSSCLYGSINSTSSLFHLLHLRNLNLAHNHFNYSQIPSEIGHLSKLTSLNLSYSSFAGHIPSVISQLSYLSILDLTWNHKLKFTNPDFINLVKNLTKLEDLRLSSVDLSSTVPQIMSNLSSMQSLFLGFCGLYGEFPIEIFYLPNLQTLVVATNPYLRGHLPEFNSTSLLKALILSCTNFSGELPASIENLVSLKSLDTYKCGFFGHLPTSLGNVIELRRLILGYNNFEVKNSSSLSWIGKLSKLKLLSLSTITFNNGIPSFLANLTQLSALFLGRSQVSSQIPSWIANMTQLEQLDLGLNRLQGLIPDSVFQLTNLNYLSLAHNNLSGTVELAKFFITFKNLKQLFLSGNNLSLHDNVDYNVTIEKFEAVDFGSCNLSHFPRFLRHQDELEMLDLSYNNIYGQIPQWLWNSTISLTVVFLSSNFLTGFEHGSSASRWPQLTYLDLTSNMLQGSLPIPPSSIEAYLVPNNKLSGKILSVICKLKALQILDLSYNNFTGTLPQCLGNFSTSIQFLHLGGNNFHGQFPNNHIRGCNIRMLNVDSNELEGEFPKSLANCSKLEALIFGSNKIYDVFPSWLGALQELKVLILESNQFHGLLENQLTDFGFPKLCIIDISHNNFSGKLPIKYFQNWNTMKMVEPDRIVYMGTYMFSRMSDYGFVETDHLYSMKLTNKGIKLKYSKIIESLVAIDLSSNNFEGHIPEVIGNLSGLRLLNSSYNNLNGSIPSSLANLTKLESLDLSRNNLIGEIPRELTQLGFLSTFNVSGNQLTGAIPHGKQFDTFENSSYQNNLGLCGYPLSRKCENQDAFLPSTFEEDQNSNPLFELGWRPVVIGYGCGVIVGALIGHVLVIRKYEWFLKYFRIKHARMARCTRPRN